MAIIENAIISLTKYKLSHALNLDDIKEISSDGLKEFRDIPYKNRSGKELLMDIFEPITDVKEDLPVIVNIHGGGLIDGNKKFSAGFCHVLSMEKMNEARQWLNIRIWSILKLYIIFHPAIS